jgi:drug/metabolite transporter (DMT)-like permease
MSAIWGIPYLFIRLAVAEVSPSFLVLARTTLATAILLPIALNRVDLRRIVARWPWLVAFAAIEIAIPWIALGSAEQHLTSSLTGLLIAGVPLVGTVFSLLTRGADRTSGSRPSSVSMSARPTRSPSSKSQSSWSATPSVRRFCRAGSGTCHRSA